MRGASLGCSVPGISALQVLAAGTGWSNGDRRCYRHHRFALRRWWPPGGNVVVMLNSDLPSTV